ncbi:hypothetical protein BOX15_Mlig004415g1 [Macrostomum lignano]|uniref:Uncharacterized protein n=1 Tax=Macrostomum lignano TaxID=282301 RepID=A0A267DK54_9PLAT|nr:hypothetical protein BOX15_Mlig004415g3 [Macrostomum lignano]PAA52313.1 hypothetical protein BOX15_Mlig004415g2 [Macrostomum lignano]PAA71823.1 hypothetical protein BOX15_Mlig004415g1 [Macrostomum lignano]
MSLTLLLLLSMAGLPALSLACSGQVRLFQVAGERSWVRVRLQLPPACTLAGMGTSAAPKLSIRPANGTVLSRHVINSLRQLPGSKQLDLLHTFRGLQAGRNFSVCIDIHTLKASSNGTQSTMPQRCALASTTDAPGPTRWDSILAVCLAMLYILALLLLALICWRLRSCLGAWSGQVTCDLEAAEAAESKKAEAAAAQPVVATRVTRANLI